MATVFDGNTLTITLSAPTAGVLDLSVARLYSEWKEWQLADFQNLGYPPAFRVVGGDQLTPGIKAGAYYFIRNDYGWRIKSTEADQTIYVEGNLAPQDSTLPTVVETTGAFTVAFIGLQPITQNVDQLLTGQQSASFNGEIAIDTVNGTAGTAYPLGTESAPVGNLADAMTIAAREGITSFIVRGDITLTASMVGWEFHGKGSHETAVVRLNGQSVDQSRFEHIEIVGAGTGEIDAFSCSLDGVSGLHGIFHDCGLDNNITLSANKTIFHNCFSQVPGTGRPYVDAGGLAVDCAFRGYIGGLELRGLNNAGAAMTVDGNPVRLRMTANCTSAAELVVGGHGIIDSNLGTIVPSDASFVSEPGIAAEVMGTTVEATFTLQDVMQLLGAIAAGDIIQQTDGSYVIKGLDDSTNRILGELATNNGRTITGRNVA